jgi:O-antigen/teichoic acid export membrane protein
MNGANVLVERRLAKTLAHPVVRQNGIFFVGSLLTLGSAFLYQLLCGRLLGPERYAIVAAVFSLYFILLVPGLILSTIGMRWAAELRAAGRQDELAALFRRASVMALGASLGIGLIFAGLLIPTAAFLHVPAGSLLVLLPAIVFLLPSSLNRGVLQGEQRFISASWVPFLETGTRAVGAAILIPMGLGATGAVLALSVGVVLSYAASFAPLRHLMTRPIKASQHHLGMPPVMWPTMIGVLGVTLLYSMDVLLVKHFLPPRQSGLYGSVVTVGRIIFMVTTSITTVMFAQVATRFSHRAPTGRVLAASSVSVAAISGAILVAFAVAPGLVLWPFGSGFGHAARYLPLFGGAMTMLSLANLLVNYLVAVHDARFVFVVLLADLAELVLISLFHQDLLVVIGIVFGVTSGTLVALLAVVVLGSRRELIARFGARQNRVNQR